MFWVNSCHPLPRPHQAVMHERALLHHWLCNQKHPWGICSCSPIVNFLKVTFYHGMVTLAIFLKKNNLNRHIKQGAHHQGEIREIMENVKKISLWYALPWVHVCNILSFTYLFVSWLILQCNSSFFLMLNFQWILNCSYEPNGLSRTWGYKNFDMLITQ